MVVVHMTHPSRRSEMHPFLQSAVARLPDHLQHELGRVRHLWQLSTPRPGDPFDAHYDRLAELLQPGDWAIDVGANAGHYAWAMAAAVGPEGRVFAFEPIPETFDLLAATARRVPYQNITAINMACSDEHIVAEMAVPVATSGLRNFYLAKIVEEGIAPGVRAIGVPLDAFQWPRRVAVLKIDAEGHDFAVLRGAARLIERDQPAILIEDWSEDVFEWLASRGYEAMPDEGASPNRLYFCEG